MSVYHPGVSETPKNLSPLCAAAMALDEALNRFEQLTEEAKRGKLDSQQSLERAARTTTEAAQTQEQLGVCMRALSDALSGIRERNQAAVSALALRAQEIQQRSETIADLLRRLAAIGEAAQALTDVAAALKQRGADHQWAEVEAKMGVVVDEARLLSEAATQADVPDLAERAGTLQKHVAAAKGKIALLKLS